MQLGRTLNESFGAREALLGSLLKGSDQKHFSVARFGWRVGGRFPARLGSRVEAAGSYVKDLWEQQGLVVSPRATPRSRCAEYEKAAMLLAACLVITP